MKRTVLLLTLAVLLLLSGSTLAIESDNYQLAWFTPLTSGPPTRCPTVIRFHAQRFQSHPAEAIRPGPRESIWRTTFS